ncbi:hypothetical protein PAMP_010831 [Pampus punctatissimus]
MRVRFNISALYGSSFLFVNTSGHYGGQRAQLLLPPLKENDTHCVSFLFYQAGGREGAAPATLNIYIKENNSPLGVPIFNSSGPAYHIWKGVELAVSTFWPNYYQVTNTRMYIHTQSHGMFKGSTR